MRILTNTANFKHDIPDYVALADNRVSIPIVCYGTDKVYDYYLYFSDYISLATFEHSLVEQHGKGAKIKGAKVTLIQNGHFKIKSMLHYLPESTQANLIGAKLDVNTNILTIDLFENLDNTNGHLLKTVVESDYSELEASKVNLLYMDTGGTLGLRKVFTVECTDVMPQKFVLAITLTINTGVTVRYLGVIRKAKTIEDIHKLIQKRYGISEGMYSLSITPLVLEYAGEDMETVHNFSRVETYHAFVHAPTRSVQLRTFKELNPDYAELYTNVPQVPEGSIIYPVYEF